MDLRLAAHDALLWSGAALLATALLLGAAARVVPAEGMSDLGLLAGAVMLAALGAIPSGLYLVLARRRAPSRARLGLATLALLVGLAAAMGVATVNERTFVFLGVPVLLLALAGLAVSVPLWRRPARA